MDTEKSNQFIILLLKYVKGKLKNRNTKKCVSAVHRFNLKKSHNVKCCLCEAELFLLSLYAHWTYTWWRNTDQQYKYYIPHMTFVICTATAFQEQPYGTLKLSCFSAYWSHHVQDYEVEGGSALDRFMFRTRVRKVCSIIQWKGYLHVDRGECTQEQIRHTRTGNQQWVTSEWVLQSDQSQHWIW